MSDELTFWEWLYHIYRGWNAPEDVTAQELAVATAMATYHDAKRKSGIYPSAEKIAQHTGLSVRQVKRLRKRVIDHGMFAVRPGQFRNGVPVLDMAIPADVGVSLVTPLTDVGVTSEARGGVTSVTGGVTSVSPESSNSSYESSEGAEAPESSRDYIDDALEAMDERRRKAEAEAEASPKQYPSFDLEKLGLRQ